MSAALPPLPATQARALALAVQPDVRFAELAGVIAVDPALTLAVLRAANSAASAPMHPIETADHALVRIGLEQARRIVTGSVVAGSVAGLRTAGIDVDELWRHVVATALIADVTAWGEVRRSAAFTAGLLHDIGRMALASEQPEAYARVVSLGRAGADLLAAERATLGTDHLAAAIDVASAWGIPDDIMQAIGAHHDGYDNALSWVVWNARRLAWQVGIGDGITVPAGVTLEPASPNAEIASAFGNIDGLLAQVDWYCGAMRGAAPSGTRTESDIPSRRRAAA